MNAPFIQEDNNHDNGDSLSSSSSSSLGDISDPDDDSSLDSNLGSYEFLQQQKFFRRLQALRRNSPAETTLDLSYFHTDAREWTTVNDDDEVILDEPVTIAELRRVHDERSLGCPTALDCLAQTIREGCTLLNKLTLKESLVTRFPIVLAAAILDIIATSKTLATFKFFGLTTEFLNDVTAERRTFITALLNALAINKTIESLEIRRVSFDDESLQKLLTKDNSTLRHLEMVECLLSNVSEQGLVDAFSHNTGLVSLHWQGNQPLMMNSLLRGLEQHEQLKDLSLFANDADTMNGEALGRAVAQCPAMESFFWFDRYSFGPNVHFDLNGFFRGLEASPSMRKVALRVQATAVVPPDDMTTNAATLLEELDLSLCEWSAASRESIFVALPGSRTMDLSSSIFRRDNVDATEALPAATWSQLFDPTKAVCLEKLDLRNCGLHAGDVHQIAQFLRQPHSRLKELDLSFNRFEMGDLQNVIDALEDDSHLEVLGLCGPIDVDQHSTQRHGFSLIAQLLCNASNLRSIDLTDTNLFVGEYADQDEEGFISAFTNHSTLKSINVDGVWFSPRQCRTFMLGLRGSLTIQNFSARYHNFALYLEDLDIGFADVLNESKSLKTLDLEQSTQSPLSVASLLRGIQHHGALRSVHLGTIDCHDAFLGQLCEMLRQNQCMTILSMRLRKWSLPEMELFYKEFFTCLADFPSLREIDVHDGNTGHPILRTTGETLLRSLEKNTSIESISVSLAFLPYELHDKILYYLRLNKLGRRLLMCEKSRRATSLWPRILGKMTEPRDVRYLHYFLHHLETTELLIHHR